MSYYGLAESFSLVFSSWFCTVKILSLYI